MLPTALGFRAAKRTNPRTTKREEPIMARQAAFYSRAGSYSRSYNAEVAEAEGRLPRTRAAAALGVSTTAFDAGCRAAGYVATEWHHVGKYANRVDYYDCDELRRSPEFWQGAAEQYRGAAKRAALMQVAAEARLAAAEDALEERRLEVEAFRQRVSRWRDCTREVRRHNGPAAWLRRCQRIGASVEYADVPGILAAVAAWRVREAHKLATERRFAAILAKHFKPVAGELDTFTGLGLRVFLHGGNTQQRSVVNIYGLKNSMNLKFAAAIALLEPLAQSFASSIDTPSADQ